MTDDGIVWREIRCPFCERMLVRAYDVTDLPEDILESGEEPPFECEGHCEHVAFYRSWGFVDPEVPEQHEAVMTQLVKRLQDAQTVERDLENTEPAE